MGSAVGRGRGGSIRVARAGPRDVGVPRVVAELVEGNDDEGDEDWEADGAEVDVDGVAQSLGGHGWAQPTSTYDSRSRREEQTWYQTRV